MTESYAAKKTVFCSSFMNLEEPANLRVASFLEAGFLEDVGNMVDDDESIVQLQYRVSRVCTSQSTRKTNFYFSWSSVNFKEKQILFVISNIDSKKILIL